MRPVRQGWRVAPLKLLKAINHISSILVIKKSFLQLQIISDAIRSVHAPGLQKMRTLATGATS
jgi:hypothetical protein